MKSKLKQKSKAIELRKQGLSIAKIIQETKASKSTVWSWIKDIPITEEQRKTLKKRQKTTGVERWIKKCRNKRLEHQKTGRLEINKNNWEHAAGCMLWWAEGNKSKNQVGITNCDVNLLKFCVFFLKKYYHVNDEDFSISVQYHGDVNEDMLVAYWKNALDIQGARQHKGYKKEKKSSATKWPYGICRIRIDSTQLANRLWGSVQEYMKFDSPDALY